MNNNSKMQDVLVALVDLVIKMTDVKNAEYNPTAIPAIVGQIVTVYQNIG